MKNTEIAFCPFKQYLSLDIYMDINRCTSEVMKIQLKYFVFFPSTWSVKLLDGEPSDEDKITVNNIMMKNMQASN